MYGKLAILAAFVAVGLSMLALLAAAAKSRRGVGVWPFYGKRVLTDAEQVFYWRLVEALPEHVILAQVQLSRFLGIKKGTGRVQWLNRINQKSADFLVCAKDFSVLAAVELDDSTHAGVARKKADDDKSKAIGDAGVKLLRWTVKAMPSAVEIAHAFGSPSGVPVPSDEGGVGGVRPMGNASHALGTSPRRWR